MTRADQPTSPSVRRYEPGEPCWIDLGTARPDRAAAFYRAVFGWHTDFDEGTGYGLCRLDGGLVAGLGPADQPGEPYWMMNISVANADHTASAIETHGGTIVSAPHDFGRAGRSAVAIDAVGAEISIWQPYDEQGAQTRFVDGSWTDNVLATANAAEAARFYAAVFGWRHSASGQAAHSHGGPHPKTSTVEHLPEESTKRSSWIVVFAVDDHRNATRRISAAGGRVLESSTASDGYTLVEDDQRARFGIQQR
ncbi:MAG: glyoxalase/bleomycin resistance protein/dioxygenase [Ilumatobacteraceae bacterium]|nr:glyoxalase/bleomycin resistance protein/dioxygenase [Ilumatobacteraceae bacterium]